MLCRIYASWSASLCTHKSYMSSSPTDNYQSVTIAHRYEQLPLLLNSSPLVSSPALPWPELNYRLRLITAASGFKIERCMSSRRAGLFICSLSGTSPVSSTEIISWETFGASVRCATSAWLPLSYKHTLRKHAPIASKVLRLSHVPLPSFSVSMSTLLLSALFDWIYLWYHLSLV